MTDAGRNFALKISATSRRYSDMVLTAYRKRPFQPNRLPNFYHVPFSHNISVTDRRRESRQIQCCTKVATVSTVGQKRNATHDSATSVFESQRSRSTSTIAKRLAVYNNTFSISYVMTASYIGLYIHVD